MSNPSFPSSLSAKGLVLVAALFASAMPSLRAESLESWVKPPPADRDDWNPPKKPFTESQLAPLVSMGTDETLVYQAFSEFGDRIPDFSTAGYKRSEEPIPDVRVVETLTPPTSKSLPKASAAPAGPETTSSERITITGMLSQATMRYPLGTDSHAMIQGALDRVAAMEPDSNGFRGAVLLKKGTWYVGNNLLVSDGVVLRGEGDGEDGTVLVFTIPSGDGTGIQIGKTGYFPTLPGRTNEEDFEEVQSTIVDRYIPTGSWEITVEDASEFAVGDRIVVAKTTNQAWIDELGMGERLRHIRGGKEGAGKRPWGPQNYQHHREIVAIKGNTITLDSPMIQSIAAVHGGGYVKAVDENLDSHCGVESLRIVSNYDVTVKDTGKDANFKNLRNAVAVTAINSWVRNVTAKHVWFATVKMDDARNATIRDCKALQPIGPKRGGRYYAYSISGSSGMLLYNCYSEDGRHDFAVGARTPGPNVFLECTAIRGGQSEPHHRWGAGTLYDNVMMIDGGSLAAINRGDSGSGHGWAAANTVFWNCSAETIVIMDPETVGENNFAFGFAGDVKDDYDVAGLHYANTRSGYWGTPKEGQYYGFAIMGDGHIESPLALMEPRSLFKQQLIDRIGKEKAMAVLK